MDRSRVTLLSAAAALALSGCAPDAVTTQGAEVNGLYRIFLGVAAVVFVVTAGLIGWSLLRYRAKPGDDELPEQFHSNLALEITWFAIPQVIVIALFVVSAMTLSTVNEEKDAETSPGLEVVEVTGFQWGWRFDFEGGASIAGTPQDPARVLLPTGDVAFVLNSTDVVHSFYVPRFLIKRDVVPGRETRIDVHIEDEGDYTGVCAEFCGLFHDRMTFEIEAVAPQEFEAWLDEQEAATP